MATPLGSSLSTSLSSALIVVHDLRGVRTGSLEDHRANARMAVGVALVGIGFAAQFDVGDVFQVQDRTVGLCESTISPNSSGVIRRPRYFIVYWNVFCEFHPAYRLPTRCSARRGPPLRPTG